MKVLFLIQGFSVTASRYRVLQYIPYLQSKGIEAKVILFPGTLRENIRFLKEARDYDVIFIQRKRINQPRLYLLRKRAKKIIYDFDDAVMYRNSKARSPFSLIRKKRFVQMIKASDYVIAGNEFLKSQVLPYNANVEVIPTTIDHHRYSPKNYNIKKGSVTIGWIGSRSTIYYLEKMKPIFDRIAMTHPEVELKIVCDTFFDCERMKVIKKIWALEEEVSDLQSFDIGIMPLMDDPWSWGKCGLKIIQYQAVGLPVVCTPVGINRDLVEDGINGFYAMSDEEWEKRLSILIEDGELRKRMGLHGLNKVLEKYTVSACAPKLFSILNRVVGKNRRRTYNERSSC